jgi:GNAT superfamily N-acetyltransferase
MAEFDDERPQLDYLNIIDRYTVLLKDGETTATIYPIQSPQELPPGLLGFLCDEFNMEIERGETSPFFDTLTLDQFSNYWFSGFAGVMVLGSSITLTGSKQWEKECLGAFFIKSNYPGRCSHICTGNFLVNAGIRGKGIGRTLTDCYLQWAPRLGYTYCMFNLVFETNLPARRIWESLNFKKLGRIKSAGILKGHDQAIDGLIYGRELINNNDPAVGAYRFDKIKYYLETGRYPAMADRQEKSRLRSSASHYNLENGKLMLKGREVISDPIRQMQICQEVHYTNHGGINKTTTTITEKYHWTRIKDTVANAIKNCPECRDPAKDLPQNKRLMTNKNNSSVKSRKLYSDQQPRRNDDVEAIVAAVQLHNLPRNDDTLLAGLDDNLIAVVEEAHRQKSQQNNSHLRHQQHDVYSPVHNNTNANQSNTYPQYHHDYYNDQNSDSINKHPQSNIPVDPEVENYSHTNGHEIEIAQALMQANDDDNDNDQQQQNDDNDDKQQNEPENINHNQQDINTNYIKGDRQLRHEETNLFLNGDRKE